MRRFRTLGLRFMQESAWRAECAIAGWGIRVSASSCPPRRMDSRTRTLNLGLSRNRHHPAWAIRALVTYDKHLYDRVRASNSCDRFAKALAAYNGGETRLHREEKMAAADGLDPMLYFGTVERYNAGRSKANFRENRQYPVKILFRLSPIYQRADWGRTSVRISEVDND